MTSDAYDHASDLSRPSVYRLNVGIGKQTNRLDGGAVVLGRTVRVRDFFA